MVTDCDGSRVKDVCGIGLGGGWQGARCVWNWVGRWVAG